MITYKNYLLNKQLSFHFCSIISLFNKINFICDLASFVIFTKSPYLTKIYNIYHK